MVMQLIYLFSKKLTDLLSNSELTGTATTIMQDVPEDIVDNPSNTPTKAVPFNIPWPINHK